MSFALGGGEVYIRETVLGAVLISWYPRERTMPDWPGRIIEADRYEDFPADAMLRGHRAAVRQWVDRQTWET
jgi:hypothetical protein